MSQPTPLSGASWADLLRARGFQPSAEDYLAYQGATLHPLIRAFLTKHPDRLCDAQAHPTELGVANPAAWSSLSARLAPPPVAIVDVAATTLVLGLLGPRVGAAFLAFACHPRA